MKNPKPWWEENKLYFIIRYKAWMFTGWRLYRLVPAHAVKSPNTEWMEWRQIFPKPVKFP